jgi:hypothetical protein
MREVNDVKDGRGKHKADGNSSARDKEKEKSVVARTNAVANLSNVSFN